MLKKFLQKIAREYLVWRRSLRPDSEVIDMAFQLSNIATALVILPENSQDFHIALNHQKSLHEVFANTRMTYVLPDFHPGLSSLTRNEDVVRFSAEDITYFGQPRPSFYKRLPANAFDIIIDFNLDFELFPTSVCSHLQAKLRVCFSHPKREPFYNFQIRTPLTETADSKFATLIKYLRVFIVNDSAAVERDLTV